MAKRVTVTFRGEEAKRLAKEGVTQAMWDIAEAIVTAAQNEAPHETGTLARSIVATEGGLPDAQQVFGAAQSGRTLEPPSMGDELAVYVSANTPYARRQHEEVGYRHAKGRKAKYLEDPANRIGRKINAAIKQRLGDKLR